MCNPSPSFWHDVDEGVTLCQKCYTRGRAALIRQGDQTSARGRRHQREGDDGMPPTSKQARTLQITTNASGDPAATARPPDDTNNHEAALQPPPSKRACTSERGTSANSSGGTANLNVTARPPGARSEQEDDNNELRAHFATTTTDFVTPPTAYLWTPRPRWPLLQGATPDFEH